MCCVMYGLIIGLSPILSDFWTKLKTSFLKGFCDLIPDIALGLIYVLLL